MVHHPAPRAQATPTEEADGRVRRGLRNREKIVEALFALVREGNLLPTAAQVAERAHVGTRTVFRHFQDMESLLEQTGAHIEHEIAPLEEPISATGPLPERIRALVARRCELYERVAPFRRSAVLRMWNSPFLRERHARFEEGLRSSLHQALPELEQLPPATAHAAEAITSFEAWDHLRVSAELSPAQVYEALELGLARVLETSAG